MKTVLARLRRCFIGILIFSILFILWIVWLGASVSSVRNEVATNVDLLKDLGTAERVLREMGRLSVPPDQWQALDSECRRVIQALDRSNDAYPEVRRFVQGAGAAEEKMAALRAELR